jgi:hypothetical protein
MERDPFDSYPDLRGEWDESTTRGVVRGLEELRDALTPDEDEDHLVRRHRGVIVLGTVVAAFWLGVVGALSAATREGPIAESALAFEIEGKSAGAAVQIGPNEWPTIAMMPHPFTFKKKVIPAQHVKPTKKKAPRK